MNEAEQCRAGSAGQTCLRSCGEKVLHADSRGAVAVDDFERGGGDVVGSVVFEVEVLDASGVRDTRDAAIVGVNSGQAAVAQDGIPFPRPFLALALRKTERRGRSDEHESEAGARKSR